MNAPLWLAGWDRASGVWAAGLVRACWQGGATLLFVWLLCQGFSAMSPTLRAWLWRLAYLKLVLTLLLPVLSVPILPAQPLAPPAEKAAVSSGEPASSPLAASQSPTGPASTISPSAGAASAAPAAVPPAASLQLSGTFCLSLLWGVGVIWCLVRVAGEWIAAGWLRGLSEPVQDEALNACCLELSERLGLHETPRLMVSEGAGSPVLLGGAKPVVILPLALLTECSQAELELVIAHELAHSRRRDLLWGWAPAIGHALFFFFPLEWLAAHEYRLAQEMACDELAIRTSHARVGDYGEALLKVAARHRPNLQSRLVTVGIVESSQILKRRLLAMKEMGSFPVRPGMAVTVIVGLGMLGCLPWQLTPRALAGGAFGERRPVAAGQPDSAYREQPVASAPTNADALCYHPKAGEAYVYAVRIETTQADYTETMSGNAVYTCRAADEAGMLLTCNGGLMPVRRPTQGHVGFISSFTRLHTFGFGALGMPQPFAGPNEMKIDAQGHLLSTRGDTPLPRALGDLAQLIVETLPAEGANWEVQNNCAIVLQEDRPIAPFSHFAHTERRSLPASETLSYTLSATNGDLAQIEKHYELRTNERISGVPTLQLIGDGKVAFDRKLGMPRTLEFKLTLTEQQDRATTVRIPVTVTYRLLAGDEREKALHPPAPPPPVRTPLVTSEQSATLADLHSSDGFKVIAAANKLAAAQPGGDRQQTEQALIAALDHKDGFARQAVVKALGVWGGSASVPPLIHRLDDESFAVRWAVFEVLGERKDARAAEPIAKWLEKDRGFASAALRKLGPLAAQAVAQRLDAKDWGMRIDLCRLLKEIGTTREIPALQRLSQDEQRLVADAAADAVKTIQQRGGGASP